MADSTLYDTTVQTEGTLALAHEKIIRVKRTGAWENITGDVNALAAVPTKIVVTRENYGNKGRTSESKLGDNYVVSFAAEAVRDNTGAIAQTWLVALLGIAKATGAANAVDVQVFDAKDPALGAIEGNFTVTVADLTTGYADKGGYTFTLTSNGVVRDVESPIAGTGVPVAESALPTLAAASENVYVRGYKVDAITAATIGGVAVTSIEQIPGEPNIVVLEVPTGTAGSAPIVLTNAIGVSVALPYTRA